MNATDNTSIASQIQSDSNDSSLSVVFPVPQHPHPLGIASPQSPVQLLNQTQEAPSLESPLLSLTEKPLSLMTEQELREQIEKWRTRRLSQQTLRAALVKEAEEESEAEVPKKPSAAKVSEKRLMDFMEGL